MADRHRKLLDALLKMLHFLEKLTTSPEDVGPDDVTPLRAAGIRDEAILDGIYVCTIFCTYNRLVDAFGCAPLTPSQMKASAKMLLKDGGYEVP